MSTITRYINFSSGESIPFEISQEENYIDLNTNINDLQYQINNNTASSCFRIFVLYPDETIHYEIPGDFIKQGGSYSENYQNGQRRSLSFTLYNEDGRYTPDVNVLWAGTKLLLEMGVILASGVTLWFRKGIYVISKVTPTLSVSGKEVQVSANDKFSLFEGSTGTLDTTYEIPIDTNIEDAIRDILFTENGSFVLDPIPFIYNSKFKGKTTQSLISKNAGETLGSILLELATQLSAEIFYNAAGALTLVPIDEVSLDSNKPLLYSYDTSKGDLNQLNFDIDLNTIYNRVIVIGNNSNGNITKAVAVNDDPASPLCYQRIGYRTANIINDSNITSDILAQERADYELRQQLVIKSSVSGSVLFNPLLEINNLIAISDEFFELNKTRFLIQSISCSLDFSGQMNITFSNLQNLPFVVS